MTPQKAAVKLRTSKMTLAEIAKSTRSKISTIYGISKGKPCMWEVGDRLIRLATKAPK